MSEASAKSLPARPAKSRASLLTFLIVFSLIWSTLVLFADCYFVWSWYRQLVALGYSAASGEVTASKIVASHGSRGSVSYRPEIHYAYQVGGQNYAGDRYRYGQVSTNDGNAQRVVAAHPIGRSVTVYYVHH